MNRSATTVYEEFCEYVDDHYPTYVYKSSVSNEILYQASYVMRSLNKQLFTRMFKEWAERHYTTQDDGFTYTRRDG